MTLIALYAHIYGKWQSALNQNDDTHAIDFCFIPHFLKAEFLLQSQKNNQLLDADDKEKLAKLVASIENLHIRGAVK